MPAAKVTRHGRITIPAEVRQALRVVACDRIDFVEMDHGRYEILAVTRSITELKGMLGKPSHTVSVQEMNAAILMRGASARCSK